MTNFMHLYLEGQGDLLGIMEKKMETTIYVYILFRV